MELPVIDSSPTKETSSSFHCSYCDTEAVRKIAQLLLSGLASACVDNTTGDLFRSPSFVAVAFRKEMVEYLTTRSESFIAAESEVIIPEHPADLVQDFIDDFVNSKRNLFSWVSSWLSSKGREDKIDHFAQELETQNFWPQQGRREAVSELLLKNIDIKSALHCTETFDTSEQLAEHRSRCKFRPVSCSNDGCNATVSALHAESHDSVCPFKVIPCEKNCEQKLTRGEMDRHCVTECPMKLVNCPFYQVGCESALPQCTLPKHCAEFIHPHLLCVLQAVHKQEASTEELRRRVHKQEASTEELWQRVQLLEKSHSLNEFSEALDVRSLTLAIKEQESRMKKIKRELGKIQGNY